MRAYGDNDTVTTETLPPSLTWSDAVTAPESSEEVAKEHNPMPEKGKDDGTTDLGDTVISHPNLRPALSNFLDKIAPWRSIMPEPLVQDMNRLGDLVAKMRQTEQPVK